MASFPQTSLREALYFASSNPGTFELQVPPSVCFGTVALGGVVMSFAHRAAIEYVSRLPQSSSHRHVLNISTNFFRPTLAAPIRSILVLRSAHASRASTTLHMELQQNNKVCAAGYITMVDFSLPGQVSVDTGWQLTPPASEVSFHALENDLDSDWISYLTPFSPASMRRPQSYMKYYLPIKAQRENVVDQWVTPGWKNEDGSAAVWTNELVHFALDNVVPMINDLMSDSGKVDLYKALVKAGLAQRQARRDGNDDRIWGEGLSESDLVPWIISSTVISTEIKKPLPDKGTKWLFMRVEVKSVRDSRLDHHIVMLDEDHELLAISNQVVQVIPTQVKNRTKASL